MYVGVTITETKKRIEIYNVFDFSFLYSVVAYVNLFLNHYVGMEHLHV